MRKVIMHKLGRRGTHEHAPKAYRDLPVVTGDHRLDASIARSKNSDGANRLARAIANAGPQVRRIVG
jgi:hypothetical protein